MMRLTATDLTGTAATQVARARRGSRLAVIGLGVIGLWFLSCPCQIQAASAVVAYTISHAALDGGGGRMHSVAYTLDTSFGELGGMTRTASANVTARVGFAGQLEDPPVSANAQFSVVSGSPVAVSLTATDVENDALKFRIITGPTHGTLTGTAPALTYTPGAGFTTADQFTFVANDGFTDSAFATVTLLSSAAGLQLQSPRVLSANELQIDVKGLPNRCYRLEVSLDLVQWTTLANAKAGAVGLVTFTDRGIGAVRATFYRAAEVPCSSPP